MQPSSQQRIRELFDQAVKRPQAERSIYLEGACEGDPDMFQAVMELLRKRDAMAANSVQRIGRYEIRGELGRGAMGIVYDAVDPLIGRSVALKVIRIEGLTDPREAEFLKDRLFREARSAGQLFHPCIVVVLDVGQEGETAFIAMEKVEGQTLQHMLASGHRPGSDETLSILHQTAAALDYAHQHGVVHRDIKPANIMVQPGTMVKVADFGIAKIMSSQNATQSGVVMGTPTYMSPEQIEGQVVDGRSDQFALAVLAYEMLTGVRPFQGDSLAALAHKIVYAERPLATVANPALPFAINPVLSKAFSRSPGDRYACCGDLVRSIESVLDTAVIPAPLAQPASVPAMATATQASSTQTTNTQPTVTQASAFAPSPATQTLTPTQTIVAQKSGGKSWIFAVIIAVVVIAAVGAGSVFFLNRSQPSAIASRPTGAVSIVVQRFLADPTSIEAGAMSKLNWSVTGAQQITIDHGIGTVAPSGSLAVTPTEPTTYVLVATGAGPEVRATAAIDVKPLDAKPAAPPTATVEKPASPSAAERARELYDSAADKRRAGLVPQAAALLRESADLGDVRAMLELAEGLRDGEGMTKNTAEAVRWFQKAAQNGNASAMVELGAMYILGDGIKTDNEEAVRWFQRAADHGNSAGMYDLASMYESGRGVSPDIEKAKALYRKSADLGNTEARRRLLQLTSRK